MSACLSNCLYDCLAVASLFFLSASGYLVVWKIIVVAVASAVGVGVVVLVIALHFPKVTKLPTGSSSLLHTEERLDGDDHDHGDRDHGERETGDEYWTGVNPAIPSPVANNTASAGDNNAGNLAAVLAVARNNRTHEQVQQPHRYCYCEPLHIISYHIASADTTYQQTLLLSLPNNLTHRQARVARQQREQQDRLAHHDKLRQAPA